MDLRSENNILVVHCTVLKSFHRRQISLVANNDITKCVHFPLAQRFFADDFNTSLKSANPHSAHSLLQGTINAIISLASLNGLRLSSSKTYLVIFKSRNPIPPIQPLFLQNLEKSQSVIQLNIQDYILIANSLGLNTSNFSKLNEPVLQT